MDEIFNCDHSNKSYQAKLSLLFIVLYKVVLILESANKMKATEQYFPMNVVHHAVQGGPNF